jgi:hypothetical protein
MQWWHKKRGESAFRGNPFPQYLHSNFNSKAIAAMDYFLNELSQRQVFF